MDVPKDMRNYFVIMLKRGDRYLERGAPGQAELQAKHLAYSRGCAEKGLYKAYGPLTDGGQLVGLCVVDLGSLEEATAIAQADPGTRAGHFDFEVHPCFWPSLDAVEIDFPA